MPSLDYSQCQPFIEAVQGLASTKGSAINPWIGVIGAIGGALTAFVPNAAIEKYRRKKLAEATMLQLYAEIKATLEMERHRKYTDQIGAAVQAFKSGHITEMSYRVEIAETRFPIYAANLTNIGLLAPNLQVKIVLFYQIVESIIQDIKPGGILNARPAKQASFEELHDMLTRARSIGTEILATVERIHPYAS